MIISPLSVHYLHFTVMSWWKVLRTVKRVMHFSFFVAYGKFSIISIKTCVPDPQHRNSTVSLFSTLSELSHLQIEDRSLSHGFCDWMRWLALIAPVLLSSSSPDCFLGAICKTSCRWSSIILFVLSSCSSLSTLGWFIDTVHYPWLCLITHCCNYSLLLIFN